MSPTSADGVYGWLDSLSSRGIRLGLGAMTRLLRELGNPQDRFRSVHVAGSDGKGSTCAMIYSVLRQSGRRAAMYSSPHVVDVRECISVDGTDISEDEFVSLMDSVRPAVEALQKEGVLCTSFEVMTAASFVWFARCGVEYAVIETGMGGTDDATNVIVPDVSVITNVSMEHTAFLGGTIEEIASKKAGIIKPRVPVVTSAKGAALEVVKETAYRKGCDVTVVSPARITSIGTDGSVAEYGGREYRIGLPGSYQAENAAVAIEAVSRLHAGVAEDAVARGLECSRLGYRMQKIAGMPMVVDGTHTVAGMRFLCDDVPRIYGNVVAVFGVLSDKNISELARMIAGISDLVVVTAPDSGRAADAAAVSEAVGVYTDSVVVVDGVCDAIDYAVENSNGRTILVTGSFRMAEGAFEWLRTRSARYST